ncbi:MAG: histidine kinase [Acidimicrobiales bacterium]|nr:histidine kinase [Hyphomonadaceae bacterium]RZV44497.1 MAG: histidine kinase [Acidimicrobiales bacterium]
MEAKKHPKQQDRLTELRRYEILDTPREGDFDDIVELASQICDVPISVINLIDENRQWFKAEVGIGARETPLETSICSHVILEDDFVEIKDTHLDPRTSDNELCAPNDGLRYYAGWLLNTERGFPIGTLCVLDNKPNTLSPFQKNALRILSRRVMRELDLRLSLKNQLILQNEMDHRVKNSLQTVLSMVRLYKNRADKDNWQDAFDAVTRRIEAVAALHQELHQASTIEKVNLKSFLKNIVTLLGESIPDDITLTCRVEDVPIGSKTASAISIIVSEFVANAVKHAFSEGDKGRIAIIGKLSEADDLIIHCNDNGTKKLNPESKQSTVEGLGLRLMQASASQIGAMLMSGPSENGFVLKLEIPNHDS